MITIVKGNDKIVCTKGTFEEQYKILGYQIASEKKEATEKVASFEKEEDKKEEEIEVEEALEENLEEELEEKYKINRTVGRKRK